VVKQAYLHLIPGGPDQTAPSTPLPKRTQELQDLQGGTPEQLLVNLVATLLEDGIGVSASHRWAPDDTSLPFFGREEDHDWLKKKVS
jgi:hypothetical protein